MAPFFWIMIIGFGAFFGLAAICFIACEYHERHRQHGCGCEARTDESTGGFGYHWPLWSQMKALSDFNDKLWDVGFSDKQSGWGFTVGDTVMVVQHYVGLRYWPQTEGRYLQCTGVITAIGNKTSGIEIEFPWGEKKILDYKEITKTSLITDRVCV